MKKIFYFIGLALLAASCNDDYTDWANPQSNPQLDPKTVTLKVNEAAPIDYDNVSAETVQIFNPESNAPEDAEITTVATLYNDDKSLNYVLYPDAQGNVDADQLRAAAEYLYGLDGESHPIQMDIVQEVKVDGEAFRMTNNDTKVSVKTKAGLFLQPGHVDGYLPMTGDPGGKVFTYTFDNPGAPTTVIAYTYRAFSGEDKEAYKVGGSYEDPELDGPVGYGAEAFVINVPFRPTSQTLSYTVTFDLEKNEYSIVANSFNEFVYLAGDANNWGAQPLKLTNATKGTYQGFYYIGNEFKFRASNTNWDTSWGGTLDALVKNTQDNIASPAPGFYCIDFDMPNLKASLTEITTIGVIGSFEGNSWSSDVAKLSYNTSTGAWEGECEIPAGIEFKFRANDAWTINWGGDFLNLSQDGPNLKLAIGGVYKISLKVDYPGAQSATLTLK